MKNLIYFVMGILFGINLQAQIQNTFMTNIDAGNVHNNNNGVIIIDNGDGFMIVSASICDQNTVSCLDLIKTNYNGIPLWSNNFIKYPYGLRVAGGGLIKKQDDNFLLFAGESNINGIYNQLLININQSGDSISAIPVGENVIAVANRSIFDGINNDYIILYTSGTSEQPTHAVLQQVFANGTLGWSKTFAPNNYTSGVSLSKMEDNGFAIGLMVQNASDLFITNGSIIRTNLVGDTLWSKWLPGNINTWSSPALHLAVQANHNIAAVWAIDTFLYVPGEGLYNQYPPTVFCLSESGELLWKHVFVTRSWKTINSIRTTANGDIIGCGYNDGDGFIFRLSATGELLWEHEYYNSYSSVNYFFLFDLVETHEGNIAATGVVTTDIGQGAIDNDIGLLLVDANGCIAGSCEDTIYLSASNEGQAWVNLSKPRFGVSPNPASNQTTLTYHLPPNTQNAQSQLLIHDIFGRQVAQYNLSAQQQNFTFDTANLPNGIYVYTIWANKQAIYTNKFIKQ